MPDYSSLVKPALKGDYDAFEQLVEHHKDRVYGTCLLLLGSVPEGLEAAEQVFVAAYRSLHDAEGKPFSEWIYRRAETHASALHRELERRDFSRRPDKADALKTPNEIKAPPGFTQAIRERLELDAGERRKAAARRRLRLTAAGVAAASAALLAGWAVYHYIPSPPAMVQANTPRPVLPQTPPATDTPTPPEPPATVQPVQAAQPLPTSRKQPSGAIPEIVISGPRHDGSSPEQIFRSVSPPLKSPPAGKGNKWTVELTDDQFWSLHKLLKDAYRKMKVPESAIPGYESRIRIVLRFVPAAGPVQKQEPAAKPQSRETEYGGRLPAEDLMKGE